MWTSSASNPKELILSELGLGVTGTIFMLICRMWDVNSAVGRYLGTDFIVFDKKGNLMHCTIRRNIAHNLLKLKEGAVYSMKDCTAQPNKDDFLLLRSAHFSLDGFDRYPFQFMEFDSLEHIHNKYFIDVAGYVTNVGKTTTQKSRSKTLDFHLANNRGQSARITFWGSLSDMLIEKRTRHVGLYPVVLTAMSVKLYNSEPRLL